MAEAVTRDMAFSDWLKLAALCLFPAQSVSKNKSICDCAGARPQSDRSILLCNSLLTNVLSYESLYEATQLGGSWSICWGRVPDKGIDEWNEFVYI